MNKKLFMLWTFLLCFVGGISAAEITIDANNSTFAADANGNIVATSGDVTFTYEKGGSSSDIAGGLQASELRVYKSSTFTVSSTKNITKIVFTTTKATNDADGFTTSTGTYTVDATNSLVGTWEGTSSSVTFEASGHQVRLSQIVVTLDESEAAVKTPVLTPAGGSYLGTQSVTISCETADAKIYYTLDGNDPTTESAEYTAPVEITETATLKAIAIKGEDKSSIASASYTILANIANTVDAPMTVAEALAAIANNSAETLAHADNKVYVKGIVKYISEISTYYGNATYSIVNAEGDADTLLIFRGKYLDDAKFTAEDSAKFVPGSSVVIYGNLVNYNGTTPEMATNNYLVSFEEPKAEEEATWKDIKVDFTNGQIITSEEKSVTTVGIVMNEDGTATRVAADDATANAVVKGAYHSDQHGLGNFSATVKVEGPVKIGMGTCAWGGIVTIKDENGNEVANAFNTNNGACWATADGAEKNVIYTYYKGEAATLTIAGGSYTPYFSVEAIALEDIPTVMKVNYSLGESGATGILPANFEINDGEKFATPANRTLYVEGKTLTGWTDGTNNYTIGQEITAVADTEITLVPVFTANTVTIDERQDAVSIVWDFQQKNGAPVVAVQGKTMIWVAQAVVNGETIDVKMDIDATNGKVANGSWQDWCQMNPNTKLTIPAVKGTVIELESYNPTTTTTIAGDTIKQETKTPVYTYEGTEPTVDIIIGDGSYWRTVKATIPAILPEDITVDVTEGDIAEAVEAEKAKVAKVGNITINLTEGVAYTANSSIVAPAGLVINGNGAVITASAELVTLPAEPTVAANDAKAGFYEITSPIVIENAHVKAAKAIVKSKAKYLVSAIKINNSIIEMTAQAAVVDFSGSSMGYPTVLSVNNSTVWSAQSTNKPFFTSQSGNSPGDINDGAEETQTISFENSTLYNIAYNKNFNELRQKGKKYLVFTVKNNIIVNSGKANFLQGMNGGQGSTSPTWTVENNTFGQLADGVFTDVSASQTGCGEVVNSITTDPQFKDVANGDFTVYAGSDQAKEKIGDPRWLVEYDETLAPATDITVDVTEGDIAEAVEAEKAKVAKVGNITINLTEGAAYTVSKSILAPASLVLNGDSATIDASALAEPMIITDTVALTEWKVVENIAINNVVVKGLGKALFYSSGKNLNITNFVVDNSVIEVAKDVTVFDFTKGSVAMNFAVKNSTLYAPTATTKSVYSSQGGEKGDGAGATTEAPQTFAFENSTLYNITYNKNLFSHRSAGQTWIKYVIKNNIVVNSGKANFMTSINGGGDSKNPQYDVTTNSVGTLADGTYTDLSASQMVQSVVMGTLVTTDPQFKDVANGDFTVYAGSDQAKEKIGDPRWLVEYDETLSGIDGVTVDGSSVNGADNGAWYNLQGVRVNGKPTQKGIYIHNGKKIVVK